MISDPNVFFLGTEEYNDEARLVFADGEMGLGDDPGEIDPTKGGDFDWHWSIEAGGGDWRLINESTDEQFITARLSPTPDVKLQIHERTKFMSGVRDLTHHGESVAFTDFTNLSFEDDDGEFLRFDRQGESDYDVYVHEGSSEERIFTESDDGTFDAATLEGHALAEVAELDQDETVTGNWAFDGFITQDLAINADVTAELADVVSVDTVDFAADNGTVSGSEIITEAHPYYPDASDDTATASDVGLFHFGDDLAITETAEGIQVDNVMATIPSDVYDDGTQVVEDANGLDFVDPHISAVDQGNGIAEIGVSLPGTLLHSDVGETVTGDWTFDTQVTGSIDHAVDADNATNADHAATADHATGADQADNSDALGGAGRQSFTEYAGDETITGGWLFDNGPDIAASEELTFTGDSTSLDMYHSESTGRLNVEYNDGSGSQRLASYDPDRGLIAETNTGRTNLELTMAPGNVFLAGFADHGDANWSRTVGVASGATAAPHHQFNAGGGGAYLSGTVEIDSQLEFSAGSSGRIYYDRGKDGSTLHIQREQSAGETAISIQGTDVGINGQTDPSYPLDVAGEGRFTSAIYAHGDSQVATRPWANSNFNDYTFSENHDDLSGVSSSDHHSRYSDSEARSAVNNSGVDINGDAGSVDGYHIHKNGSDSNGVINFKT